MFYIIFFIISITIYQANSYTIQSAIHKYYKSDGVQKLRKDWELYRKPIEHSIAMALKETVGYRGMNVYISATEEPLAMGYYHDDNQIRLIVENLKLQEVPHFWMPEVQFSLASNVLKLHTTLSKMMVHGQYSLMRNQSRIIYNAREQDPFNASPFLFQQVPDVGRIMFSIDGCVLSGFVIATLSGESVNLGYGHYKLIKCVYTVEIYRPGDHSPPVIAQYQPQRDDVWGLGIRDLLIKPIRDDVDGKLQAAVLSFVNTSSLFGDKLQGYIDEQKKIFSETAAFLTEIHRNLNKITIQKNNGQVALGNHYVFWDNGRADYIASTKKSVGNSVSLTRMVLTGLDTMYSAHIGGPYKMETMMIAEEMRYSTLQAHGHFELPLMKGKTPTRFAFSTEINDLAVNLQMDVRLDKSNKDKTSVLQGCSYKILQVTGFRRMISRLSSRMHGSVESMIYGYLLNEVPKVIRVHLKAILRKALLPPTTTTPPPATGKDGNGFHRPAAECSEGDDDVYQRAESNVPSNKRNVKSPKKRQLAKEYATEVKNEEWTSN
ncbi:unnamed protein product [Spodoptera littoralis]|uniref:Uncharacterized protein n=1 Tax=Spodoptera littoralis TaxID=7109 RepID=A0A9P0HZF3_SPOLI|nr:unnamed protein product [Spodoptera littoralis]